jgi:hypothetical protein
MKLKINRHPIYGLTIKTGKIETFHHRDEAIQFLTSDKPLISNVSSEATPKTIELKKASPQSEQGSTGIPAHYSLESNEVEVSLGSTSENNQ